FYVFVASSLAAGAYATGLVVWTGRVGETVVNLHILWLRLASVGRYLGSDDRVESEVRRSDRRHRIIPFGAMVAIGIVVPLLWVGTDLIRCPRAAPGRAESGWVRPLANCHPPGCSPYSSPPSPRSHDGDRLVQSPSG